MSDRLTRWEGRDENGQRAVMVNRDKPFHEAFQDILQKLARFEDKEEPMLPVIGKPMTDEEMAEWVCGMIKKRMK